MTTVADTDLVRRFERLEAMSETASERTKRRFGTGLGRLAAASTFLAVVIGAVSGFLFLAAADFHPDRLLEPVRMLGSGSSSAELLRWGALTDMLGYYILLIPLFLSVGENLRRARGPIADLPTVGGLMYSLMGGATAVVLAFAAPPILDAYREAEPGAQAGLAFAFTELTDVAYKGVWQTLDAILVGSWALGTGLLIRKVRRGVGTAGVALGLASVAASAVRMTEADISLGPLLAFATIWASLFWLYVIWLAILLARGSPLLPPPEGSLTEA
jgi:hypothetical protein